MKNFERTGGQTAHPACCAVIYKTYKSCGVAKNDETVIHTILSSRDEMISTNKSDLMVFRYEYNILGLELIIITKTYRTQKENQMPVAYEGPFRKTNAWVPTVLQSNTLNLFVICAKSQKIYHSQP
ncbi:hypothetical protein GcC1_176028 [Golovinomyces cichoracearum]|uniref:Uncharacterized protein n=1 Tax=Golovinomyces cichoracearum TaxID=62708 RepID=A0A420HP94_9PEZI|nr:hypothetical protein GcC1_176028 [Golovinomyces cichoracearum]